MIGIRKKRFILENLTIINQVEEFIIDSLQNAVSCSIYEHKEFKTGELFIYKVYAKNGVCTGDAQVYMRKEEDTILIDVEVKGEISLIYAVYSINEAASIWGISLEKLYDCCKKNIFKKNEARSSMGTWLITDAGMRRIFGPTSKENITIK